MPGIVRRVLVYASINGLVLQAHGAVDNHKAIQIDYKTRRITEFPTKDVTHFKKDAALEIHGILGQSLLVLSSLRL